MKRIFLIAIALALASIVLPGCTAKELASAQGTTSQPAIDALQAIVTSQAAKVSALQAQLAATTQPSLTDTAALATAQKQLTAEQTALDDANKAKNALQTALAASNATISQLQAGNVSGAIGAVAGPLSAIPGVGQYAAILGTLATVGYGIYQQVQAKKANTNTQSIVAAVHNNTDASTHASILADLPAPALVAVNDARTAMGISPFLVQPNASEALKS